MNKKGFTMVELLTTIVILGVISVMGIIAVTKVLDSAKSNHYNTLLKNMKIAAESYFSDNRNNLPKAVGQNNKVTAKVLIGSKYLDSLKDNKDKLCDVEKSVVTVYKTAVNGYKYVSSLKCDNYDNRKDAVTGDLDIKITLTKQYNNKDDNAVIKSSDGVRSYRYIIYKNAVLLYDSGVIDEGIKNSITASLDYKDKVNNGTNIRVVVSATDIYGNTKQASQSVNIENKNAPICGTDIKGSSTSWTNKNRTISINCVNNDKAKCKQARYSKIFDSTTKNGVITIEGDNGVNTDCQVKAYVDKTKPSCIVSGKPKNWVSVNQNLTVKGEDDDSGVKEYSWTSATAEFSSENTTKKTDGNNTYTAWVKDKVGNVGTCNTVVDKIDTEDPTCDISITPTTTTSGNVTLTVTGSDTQSGVKEYSWTANNSGFSTTTTKTVSDNGTYKAWVKDNAGRVGSCSKKISNINRKPATPTIDNPTGGNWTNGNINLTVKTTTAASEIGYWYYSYDNTNFTKYDSGDYNSYGKNNYTTSPFSAERNQTAYIRVCNTIATSATDALNCSDSASTNIRIDKTKPTIDYALYNDDTGARHYSGSWSKNGLYRYLYPADSGSGVNTTQYNSGSGWNTENNIGKFWLSERNENVSFRVKDNAGNYSDTLKLHIMIDYSPPTKPTINLNGYTSGDWANWSLIKITASSTDANSGIDYYEYSHNGINWSDDIVKSAGWNHIYENNKTKLSVQITWDGNWNFYIRAVDKLGNKSEASNMFTIRRDTTVFTPNLIRSELKNASVSNCTDSLELTSEITCNVSANYKWSFETSKLDYGSGVTKTESWFLGSGDGCTSQDGNPWGSWTSADFFKFTNCTSSHWAIRNHDHTGNISNELKMKISYHW